MRALTDRLQWSAVAIVFGLVVAVVALTATSGPEESKPATPIPNKPAPLPAVAALGDIETIVVDGGEITLTGWAIDLDDPTSSELRVSVDGAFVTTIAATDRRPDLELVYRMGEEHGFATTVTVTPGTHEICLFTSPDDDLVACDRIAHGDHLGALITPNGIVVELLEVLSDGYEVLSPCGNVVQVADGKRVRTAQVLIDPGHGGSEVASVGPNGLGEKSLNLDVAKRTADALRERGYSVQLTRTRDVRLPIAIRAGLANALEPDIFLSLHHNGGATGRSSVPGTQVYYQHDDDQARRLGGILYEEMFAAARQFPTAWVGNALDGVSARLNDEGGDFYGIHRRTPEVTSIITEFLWLSNSAEAALLARSDVKDAEAEAIATGIDRWYRTRHKGSGYLAPFVDNFDSGGGGFEGCVDPDL